ncbi:hypothetical protein ACLBYG_08125 [Methylobacterium sp. D53M]
MVTVSTNSYFAMVRAAQLQAFRVGLPLGDKQSVPVAITQRMASPAQQSATEMIRQIIDVTV